ncbi:MAG: YybH family protein [Thermoanaerobaculales bacterium]
MRVRGYGLRVWGMLGAVVLLVALPLWARTPGESSSPEVAAIGKVLDEFIDALNTADLQRYAALFTPDATAFFPLAEVPVRLENIEQITAVFGKFFEGIRRGSSGPRYMNLAPVDVKLQLYGDTAIVSFHFRGGEMISRRTLALVKHEGKWMIAHLHASNIEIGASRGVSPQ